MKSIPRPTPRSRAASIDRPSRDKVLERQPDTAVDRHLLGRGAARVQPCEHLAQLRCNRVRTEANSTDGAHLDGEHSIVADEQGIANHVSSHFRLAWLIWT